MRPAVALAIAFVLVPWALVGCGTDGGEGVEPAAHPDVTTDDSDVRLVEKEQADLLLYASNQSFDDQSVHLTIAVDGVTVVDGDFHVEDQHNWISFPLSLSPGDHEITTEADSGAALRESFSVPRDEPRYAVIDHWGEDDSAHLTWSFHRQPVAFG